MSAAPITTVRPSVLAQVPGELADRRRLAGAVDADDEDHGRLVAQVDAVVAGLRARQVGQQLGEAVGQRLAAETRPPRPRARAARRPGRSCGRRRRRRSAPPRGAPRSPRRGRPRTAWPGPRRRAPRASCACSRAGGGRSRGAPPRGPARPRPRRGLRAGDEEVVPVAGHGVGDDISVSDLEFRAERADAPTAGSCSTPTCPTSAVASASSTRRAEPADPDEWPAVGHLPRRRRRRRGRGVWRLQEPAGGRRDQAHVGGAARPPARRGAPAAGRAGGRGACGGPPPGGARHLLGATRRRLPCTARSATPRWPTTTATPTPRTGSRRWSDRRALRSCGAASSAALSRGAPGSPEPAAGQVAVAEQTALVGRRLEAALGVRRVHAVLQPPGALTGSEAISLWPVVVGEQAGAPAARREHAIGRVQRDARRARRSRCRPAPRPGYPSALDVGRAGRWSGGRAAPAKTMLTRGPAPFFGVLGRVRLRGRGAPKTSGSPAHAGRTTRSPVRLPRGAARGRRSRPPASGPRAAPRRGGPRTRSAAGG